MQFWALIVDSFRQSRDSKIFWLLIGLTLLIGLAMASVGFDGSRVSFLFGLWETQTETYNPLTAVGQTRITSIVVYLIMDFFLGTVGVLLMIIATASVFPAMMEGGAIDVLLSKPINRPRLFLYRYIASMVFVLVQATVFVGLTFLVMGLRWGVWVPGYLMSIPLLVLCFSYVYCVSVWVAVRYRSAVAAILISVGAWFGFALIRSVPQVFEMVPELKQHQTIYEVAKGISWIPPKTADVPYLAARWAGAGISMDMFPAEVTANNPDMEPQQLEAARRAEQDQLEISPLASIGSSLIFEAIIVLLAMWRFTRQDF